MRRDYSTGTGTGIKRETCIYAGLLAVLFAMFAWRQFYGFNKNDEIYYISSVYRFFQGDAMLIDEWNNAQLFAFITYPLFCLIRLFLPSNDGIILVFRMCYLGFQILVSMYCYRKLKRFGWARIIPALFYFVTTPYNINSLSYNTLVFGFILLVLVTIAGSEKLRVRDCVLCGVFTAGAVLANPYAVLLFFIYGCLCLGYTLYAKRKKSTVPEALAFKNFLLMTAGAFLIFVLFVWFVFSRGTLGEILESFTSIVMDTERKKPFLEKLSRYFVRIHRYYKFQVYVTGLLIVLKLADRKKKVSSAWYLAAITVVTIPYVIYYGFFWEMVGINYMLIPLSFAGFAAYMASEHKDRLLFYGWYIPGVFYTFLAHFATDTGILTVSASYMIPSAASLLLIWTALKENGRRVWLRVLVCMLFAVQFTACVYQRMIYVWGDEHLEYLTCRLNEGPMKGIHTSAENAELYGDVMEDLRDLHLTSEDKLFVVGIAPWIYLSTEAECADYSTWQTLETDPLIPLYYELHPEKLPTVIYCYEYGEEILDTEFADNFISMGYEPQVMRRGMVLISAGKDKE